MSEKTPKYGNKKVVIDGIKFDSTKEGRYYNQLKLLKRAGEILDFELQPEFYYWQRFSKDIIPSGQVINNRRKYIADFMVTYPGGKFEVWDVKGMRTAIYEQKKKIIEKLYGIEIIEK